MQIRNHAAGRLVYIYMKLFTRTNQGAETEEINVLNEDFYLRVISPIRYIFAIILKSPEEKEKDRKKRKFLALSKANLIYI